MPRKINLRRLAERTQLNATMDKAVKLGGSVAMKPHKDITDGNVAVIIDNTGALLLVQYWNASMKGDN